MINNLINEYPKLKPCENEIKKGANMLLECFENGGKLLICGNGGSACDSGHIAGELLKGFKGKRPLSEEEKARFKATLGEEGLDIANSLQGSLPVISLPDQTGILTAFNNDVDASLSYGQLVYGYGQKNDVLMCISTSGNSKNVIKAAMVAKVKGLKILSLVGENECELNKLSDVTVHAPHTDTAHIQELHLPIYHALCAYIEEKIFGI